MQWYFYLVSVILLLSTGSLFGVILDRVPKEESLCGRSHCDSCKHELKWFDLVPVVTYVILGGKCRYCGKKLSIRLPLVELLTCLFGVVPLVLYGFSLQSIGMCLIGCTLLLISMLDAQAHEVPEFTLKIILTLSIMYAVLQSFSIQSVPAKFSCILSALILGGFLMIFRLATKKRVGIADVDLMFIGGLMLGMQKLEVFALVLAIVCLITSIYLLNVKKVNKKSSVAFCPILAISIYTALIFGDKLNEMLMTLYGLMGVG